MTKTEAKLKELQIKERIAEGNFYGVKMGDQFRKFIPRAAADELIQTAIKSGAFEFGDVYLLACDNKGKFYKA